MRRPAPPQKRECLVMLRAVGQASIVIAAEGWCGVQPYCCYEASN